FGANPATSVGAVRAADFDQMDEADARALYERLQRRLEPTPAADSHPIDLYRMQAEALSL
ncbi:hypothetical protein, partial [Streptomyces sp. NRRL WC-3725]|uniref:hypothetical protein n=1 Tax=Streptomyces sp. NRRL WC-3725 TaxID=1463933 RepID=UPI0005BAA05B